MATLSCLICFLGWPHFNNVKTPSANEIRVRRQANMLCCFFILRHAPINKPTNEIFPFVRKELRYFIKNETPTFNIYLVDRYINKNSIVFPV